MTKREQELMHKLLMKTITPEIFMKEINVDITEMPVYLTELLQKAYTDQAGDDVEYIVVSLFIFNIYSECYVDILCKIMLERWHCQHENIALLFQKIKSPRSVDCLYTVAQTQFEYLEFDEAFALAVKCIWALGDINAIEALEKLKLLAQSDNEVIKENAIKQINRAKR